MITPKKLIYLASPYSHDDYTIRLFRFTQVCSKAAQIMTTGVLVFSPIAHTHPIALGGNLPLGWEYWDEFDRRMIGACDELWVYMLAGWRESVGVTAEIKIADEMNKPVVMVE